MNVIRPTVFSYKALHKLLLHEIHYNKIKSLKEWKPPLYLPQDIDTIERNIWKCRKTVIAGNPTTERPYYKYPLNLEDRKKRIVLPEWYLLYWNPNDKSNLHSHPPGGCIWWLLEGKLNELKPNKELKVIETKPDGVALPNYAGAIHDYHQIINSNDESVSLHVYWSQRQ